MKVVSKYQDYWEWMITKWGKEERHNIPTWIRKEMIIEKSQNDLIRIAANELSKYGRRIINRIYGLSPGFTICAGKNYPFIKCINSKTKDINYIYTSEALIDLFVDLFKLDKELVKLNELFKRYSDYLETELTFKFEDVAGVFELNNGIYEGNDRHVLSANYYYKSDILLSGVQFSKVFGPEEVFPLIEPYVNYWFNTENKSVQITDKDKLISHGFNQYSFKKRK